MRCRHSRAPAIVIMVALAACAGTDRRKREGADGLRLRRVVRDGVVGFEASVRLSAPPAEVERWLLDFDHVAADRPNVLTSELVERTPAGWLARFRFRGILGVNPTCLTRTTRRVVGDGVILDFVSVETSFGLRSVTGSYRLTSDASGGTLYRHRLFVDSPFVTEEALGDDMREDTEAVRRRFSE